MIQAFEKVYFQNKIQKYIWDYAWSPLIPVCLWTWTVQQTVSATSDIVNTAPCRQLQRYKYRKGAFFKGTLKCIKDTHNLDGDLKHD